VVYLYIYYEIVHEAHRKKIKFNRLDNHAGLQVSANCLVCADIYNKCMKFFVYIIIYLRIYIYHQSQSVVESSSRDMVYHQSQYVVESSIVETSVVYH